jgi:hypothetical protein
MFATEKDYNKSLVFSRNLTEFIVLHLFTHKKAAEFFNFGDFFYIYGGADGTRTRDLQRDRLAF